MRSARALESERSSRFNEPPTAGDRPPGTSIGGTDTGGSCTCGTSWARATPSARHITDRMAAEILPMEENPSPRRIIHHESMIPVTEEIGERIVALLPRLRRFARALSRNQHDADDLTQAAVERALRHRGQFREGANLGSWMFGIMKNAWIDQRRTRGRRGEVALPEDSGDHPAISPVDTET